MDYSYLNDLFEDDLEEQNQSITDPLYELKSLKEARIGRMGTMGCRSKSRTGPTRKNGYLDTS